MTERDLAWLTWDNPVLIKHVRSRFRPQQAVPWLLAVAVVCASICWIGYELNTLISGQSLGFIVGLQGVALLFIGATQVAASAAKARTTGILDFHRVAPQPPLGLMLGFFLGGPVREYAVFAVTLPFALYCAHKAPIGIAGYLLFLAPLLMGAWLAHALGLLNALLGKASGSTARGVLGVLLMIYLIGGGVGSAIGLGSRFFGAEAGGTLDFFGRPVPWVALVVGYQVPLILFALYGCVRRMRSDRAHVTSKPLGLVALAGLAVMLLGALWTVGPRVPTTLIVLYSLIFASIVMLSAVTPDASDYDRGTRRARRRGREHAAPWEDLALNRGFVAAACLVVLVASTVAWNAIDGPNPQIGRSPGPISYSLPIAIGVFTVASFGLALQWFLLRFRRGGTYMGLFVFLLWGAPILVGTSLSAGGVERQTLPIMALSPLTGITIASGALEYSGDAGRAAALIPPMVLALLFNNLVTSARRRADRQLAEAPRSEDPVVAQEVIA